jgi:nucleoside-diphosphate-sugar epimerase
MWLDALALHEAGRIRTVEIRSSEYIGPGAQGAIGERVIDPLLRGKAIWIPGRADRFHTFTFTGDVARLAVAVAAEPEAHGRVWHKPSNEARTARQILDDLARLAGVPRPTIRTIPDSMLLALGLVSPLMRELRETNYQRRYDFVMDSSAAERAFDLAPTPWDTVLLAALAPSFKAGLPTHSPGPN